MTPTSDERREVAARLRDYAQLRNCYPFEAFYVRLNIALFGDNGWDRTDGDVFERLADLIDPITTVELRAPWTICMKCGARMEGYQHKPVRFCPHFGRRIVR